MKVNRWIMNSFCFLCCIIIQSTAQAQENVFSVSFDIKIKKSLANNNTYKAYLVVLQKGKSIFSPENKMKEPSGKDFFPRYYMMRGFCDKLRQNVDLQKGDYNIQVMLKKKSNECNVNDNIGTGICFPVKDDILCESLPIVR